MRDKKLSRRELSTLLNTALEHLDGEYVPVWNWLFNDGSDIYFELLIRTVQFSEKSRKNTFNLLKALSIKPKDFKDLFTEVDLSNMWLASEVSEDLIVSTLDYIGAVADLDFPVKWESLIGGGGDQYCSRSVCVENSYHV